MRAHSDRVNELRLLDGIGTIIKNGGGNDKRNRIKNELLERNVSDSLRNADDRGNFLSPLLFFLPRHMLSLYLIVRHGD